MPQDDELCIILSVESRDDTLAKSCHFKLPRPFCEIEYHLFVLGRNLPGRAKAAHTRVSKGPRQHIRVSLKDKRKNGKSLVLDSLPLYLHV